MTVMDRLLKVGDIVALLRISVASVYRLAESGELPHYKVPGAGLQHAGYGYVYMDRVWWDSLTLTQQLNFLQPCIDIIDERKQSVPPDYRLLVDVSVCK